MELGHSSKITTDEVIDFELHALYLALPSHLQVGFGKGEIDRNRIRGAQKLSVLPTSSSHQTERHFFCLFSTGGRKDECSAYLTHLSKTKDVALYTLFLQARRAKRKEEIEEIYRHLRRRSFQSLNREQFTGPGRCLKPRLAILFALGHESSPGFSHLSCCRCS